MPELQAQLCPAWTGISSYMNSVGGEFVVIFFLKNSNPELTCFICKLGLIIIPGDQTRFLVISSRNWTVHEKAKDMH